MSNHKPECCPYCRQPIVGQFKAAALESVKADFAQHETHERQRTQRDEFKDRLDATLAEIKMVRAVGDHYLEGILVRIEKKLSGSTHQE